MRKFKQMLLSLVFGALAAVLLAAPAMAGGAAASPVPTFPPVPIAPVPPGKPGICAPWHKCIAEGVGAVFIFYLIAMAGMYLYQRKGFDSLQPKQGNPRGVPVQKK
jgi:hypothetical protein